MTAPGRPLIHRRALLAGLALASCAPAEAHDVAEPAPQALLSPAAEQGRHLFQTAIPSSNGRACSTCHVLDEATTLRPQSVSARLAANPRDPLFHPLDADDPAAAKLTFAHLEKGLIRVVLPLPDNMDVIDFDGRVITAPDRKISVWRGVPTVANTAMTAPYQYDGRLPTLQAQAQAAITDHSQGPTISTELLDKVAAFQKGLFTSPRAWFVGTLLEIGVPLANIPFPEDYMALTPPERRGRELYRKACLACHGSATTDRIVSKEVHDLGFAELKPDGNVRFEVAPGKPPTPVLASRPLGQSMNIGFGFGTYMGQIGLLPTFNASVQLPRYRFRFYKDKARTQPWVDLPPRPVTVSGDPLDPRAARDANGAPIVGPNRAPQLFSTDPGRAAITGDPLDFEAFDVPQLRGIAQTAPYSHDNSLATLEDVVDTYSRFIVPAIPPFGLPAVHPPEGPGLPKESLSPKEKRDLLAFLRRL